MALLGKAYVTSCTGIALILVLVVGIGAWALFH